MCFWFVRLSPSAALLGVSWWLFWGSFGPYVLLPLSVVLPLLCACLGGDGCFGGSPTRFMHSEWCWASPLPRYGASVPHGACVVDILAACAWALVVCAQGGHFGSCCICMVALLAAHACIRSKVTSHTGNQPGAAALRGGHLLWVSLSACEQRVSMHIWWMRCSFLFHRRWKGLSFELM